MIIRLRGPHDLPIPVTGLTLTGPVDALGNVDAGYGNGCCSIGIEGRRGRHVNGGRGSNCGQIGDNGRRGDGDTRWCTERTGTEQRVTGGGRCTMRTTRTGWCCPTHSEAWSRLRPPPPPSSRPVDGQRPRVPRYLEEHSMRSSPLPLPPPGDEYTAPGAVPRPSSKQLPSSRQWGTVCRATSRGTAGAFSTDMYMHPGDGALRAAPPQGVQKAIYCALYTQPPQGARPGLSPPPPR